VRGPGDGQVLGLGVEVGDQHVEVTHRSEPIGEPVELVP
jgi:hypothetical protein